VGPLTARRGTQRARPPRGFTLVEILVVLVILALAGGLAAVALAPTSAAPTLREARRFAGAARIRGGARAVARRDARRERIGRARCASGAAIDAGPRWRAVDDDVLAPQHAAAPLVAAAVAYAGQRVRGRRHRSASRQRPQRAVHVRRRYAGVAGRARRRSADRVRSTARRHRAVTVARRAPASRWSRSSSRWRSCAVALAAGMRALAQSADGASSLKARTLALWVAQNRLANAQLADPWPPRARTMATPSRRACASLWRETVTATPNGAFRKIEIAVAQPEHARLRARAPRRLPRQARAVTALPSRCRRAASR
jgi:general secretion pathway protein I